MSAKQQIAEAAAAMPSTASALQRRSLVEWQHSPRRGHRLTALGAAVVEQLRPAKTTEP